MNADDAALCPTCGAPISDHFACAQAFAAALLAAHQRIEEIEQKDRIKTREINVLVPENRAMNAALNLAETRVKELERSHMAECNEWKTIALTAREERDALLQFARPCDIEAAHAALKEKK